MIAATRLRRGPTNSAKGAARLVADALVTAAKAGATGQVTVRCDSELCRTRHNADYADVLVMRTSVANPLVAGVDAATRSA